MLLRLSCSAHKWHGILWGQGSNRCPCIAEWALNHWIREAPGSSDLNEGSDSRNGEEKSEVHVDGNMLRGTWVGDEVGEKKECDERKRENIWSGMRSVDLGIIHVEVS